MPDNPALRATISERLKTIRHTRMLEQREVAKRAGMSGSQYSHFESGRRMPTSINLVKVCRALNVSSDYVLGISDNPRLPEAEWAWQARYAGMSTYSQTLVRKIVEVLDEEDRS